ncbi:hypothetical protein Acr_26g0003510 [Actinidia rufa]|uniref:Uncharacterized protein n=1 Tax=Actinidia rufa TaxID=165716 RepID=A0A7J0H264_9ERIC|nr:hypothetical protein Acr_26g0003510 [Actinidia rufa]
MLIDLAVLIDWAIRIHRIVIVQVRDIRQGAVSIIQRVYTLDKEGVLVYLNLDSLVELKTQQVRKLGDEEDHLTGLGMHEGKTDPMDQLDSYKNLMVLQGYSDEVMCKAFSATLNGPKDEESLKDYVKRFNQSVLKVEGPSDKVSKADKYNAVEELAEVKRRMRGKDDHKRKESDTLQMDYRGELRIKSSSEMLGDELMNDVLALLLVGLI